MAKFAYKEASFMFHRGPIEAPDLEAAKAEIRRRLGVKRLPPGTKVWDLAERPMQRWHVTPEQPVPLFSF